jgi:hypothetical protein
MKGGISMNKELMLCIIFCALFWISLIVMVRGCIDASKEPEVVRIHVPMPQWFGSEEYEKMRRLHEYHGTTYSWDIDGTEYFFTKGGEVAELWDPMD